MHAGCIEVLVRCRVREILGALGVRSWVFPSYYRLGYRLSVQRTGDERPALRVLPPAADGPNAVHVHDHRGRKGALEPG